LAKIFSAYLYTGFLAVKPEPGLVTVFNLAQNYPNPFNPTTVISYQLAVNSFVTLRVFDIIGREVRTLANGPKNAGNYTVQFDGSGLASGIYFYQIEARSQNGSSTFTSVKKFLFLK
jgi:hypothetical protein